MDDHLKLKIESYIGNAMSDEEKALFEQQIEQDLKLKKEVALAKELNHFLRDEVISEQTDTKSTKEMAAFLRSKEAKKIEDTLLKVKHEYKAKTTTPKKKNYLLVAASIAFLLISSIAYYIHEQSTPQKLYAQYYSVTDLPSVLKRGNQQDNLVKGVLKFNESDYTEALKLFDSYKNLNTDLNPSVYLYTGVANMQLEQYNNALAAFDKMIQSNSIDHSKGLWFKALLYLKKGNKTEAKITLTKIVKDTQNFKFKEAKALLKKL